MRSFKSEQDQMLRVLRNYPGGASREVITEDFLLVCPHLTAEQALGCLRKLVRDGAARGDGPMTRRLYRAVARASDDLAERAAARAEIYAFRPLRSFPPPVNEDRMPSWQRRARSAK